MPHYCAQPEDVDPATLLAQRLMDEGAFEPVLDAASMHCRQALSWWKGGAVEEGRQRALSRWEGGAVGEGGGHRGGRGR